MLFCISINHLFYQYLLHSCCGLVAQSCVTLCDPTDCSPPGSSVHGISQARILEWVAISSSRGSSQPRDWTHLSSLAGRFFTTEPPGEKAGKGSWKCYSKFHRQSSLFPGSLTANCTTAFGGKKKNFFFFWLCSAAWGLLAPWPRIEPASPTVESRSLSHWTTREVPLKPLDIFKWSEELAQAPPLLSP